MKQYLTRIVCLLSLAITACSHRQQAQNQPPLAPPIEDAPLAKPDTAPKDLPPVVVTPAAPKPADTASAQPKDQPKPVPKHKKPKPPAQATTTQTPDKPADPAKPATPPANQEASSGEKEAPAIGVISSGGPDRSETENSLNNTQHSLDTLNRKLSDQEEKTKAQILEYIKQARAALTTNDLDGAKNLATKAKLLLNELIPQ
jgi:hypothetical protein